MIYVRFQWSNSSVSRQKLQIDASCAHHFDITDNFWD